MKHKKFLIVDHDGINSRSSAKLVAEANKYKANVFLKLGKEEANLKSIMNVMALIIQFNDEIEILASGVDEDKAVEKIEILLKELKLIS